MDWEEWLRTASKRPSDNEDAKRDNTEQQIRDALRGKSCRVYVKGSYANNTNVRLNYDVDIAVEYYGKFYFDFMFAAKDYGPSDAGITAPSTDKYTNAQFKADIRDALEDAFGANAIEDGNIAFRVRGGKTTLPADVVPSWEYRRYDSVSNGIPQYHEGSRVFPASGGSKDNYPKIQRDNGTAKNLDASKRYKRMVRCFKKLQTYLVENGFIDEELPSYLSECLVYNVTNDAFGHDNYYADMRAVLAQIFNATLPSGGSWDWHHVHELQYLFRGNAMKSVSEVHIVVAAAWDAMGFDD
jgi:hypothetical protein